MQIETPLIQPEVYQAALQVLAEGSAGIFTDLDGTLAPLRPDPRDVSISSHLRDALSELNRRVPVIVLTGRKSRDARDIVGLNSLTYVGNHGLEIIKPDELEPLYTDEALPYLDNVRRVNALANIRLKSTGVMVENKLVSISLHYRNAVNARIALDSIADFISLHAVSNGLEAHYGKMVVDLRPPTGDKGTALLTLMSNFRLGRAIVLGDDSTDIDSFRALSRVQTEGARRGLSIAVATEGTPAPLIAMADYVLRGTQEVEALLIWLAAECR